MSEVCSLVSHISVMPATNAVSERSFSSLRRVKNYLRSTITENHLNSVMLLHIHKEKTDSLSLIDVANDFSIVANCPRSSGTVPNLSLCLPQRNSGPSIVCPGSHRLY